MKVDITFPPSSEQFIKLQCNGDKSRYSNPPEAPFIDPYLKDMNPICVLDLGCGLGRIGVYLFKRYEWNNTRFIMADGNSGTKQLAGLRDGEKDFYNSMRATREFCEANGMFKVNYLNLENQNTASPIVDLVVSFYALGFHWPINKWLNQLYMAVNKGCLLLFGMRINACKEYREWCNKQIQNIDRTKYKVIDFTYGVGMNILVLEKIWEKI